MTDSHPILIAIIINNTCGLKCFLISHSRPASECGINSGGNLVPFRYPRESGDPEEEVGFPRIKSGAGLVKPGMTIIAAFTYN